MSYETTVAETARQHPFPLTLRVTCDGAHGFFSAPTAAFAVGTNQHPRDSAVAAGWKFSPDGPVYCPDCAKTA